MAAPALSIPVRANLDDFKSKMNEASSHVGTATRSMLKQFSEMNAQIGGPIAASMAANVSRATIGMVGKFALVVGAAKLVGDGIDNIRDRIKEMVDVAERASHLNVSPEFLQAWDSAAKGATDRIELMDKALTSAFQAMKPVLNPDWSVWDDGLRKVTAVEKAMRETRELFTTSQNFSGFDLFVNAQSQEEKIKAVLLYMQQLKLIGQEVAALDIGEKMFGARFTDEVRLGKESFDGMLRTIEAGSKTTFISNESARNAKELDDRLKDAHATISERLKPDWEDLANAVLRIKGVWVSVLEAVAAYKATEIKANPFQSSTRTDGANDPDPNVAAFGNPAILNSGRRRRGEVPQVSGGTAPSGTAALDAMSKLWDFTGAEQPGAEAVPTPRRRPNVSQPSAGGGATRDRFDTSAESIERRTAALQAETETIGQNSAARDKARLVAQLQATAMQLNAEAGKGENVVTAEQKARIEEVAGAYEKAAASLEKLRVGREITFTRNTAFLSSEDVAIAQQLRGLYGDNIPAALASTEASAMRANNAFQSVARSMEQNMTDGFTSILSGTASVKDGFKSMAASVLKDIQRIIVKTMIVGPLMKALGGLGGLVGGGAGPGVGETSAVAGNSSFMMGGQSYPMINHTGYGPGDSAPRRAVPAAVFNDAPRFHSGIGPGERAAIIRNDESVLTPGQMRQLSPSSGGVQQVQVDVGVSVDEGGNLQAYVKNVSQKTASDYAGSQDFQRRAHAASVKGNAQRWNR